MSKRPSHQDAAAQREDDSFLEMLIAAPPAPAEAWRRPIALRSRDEHRNQALNGLLLRTWFDRWLHHAERLLGVAALLVFIFWVVDGPVRDWFHMQQSVRRAPVVQAAAQPTALVRPMAQDGAGQVVPASVPLPFTTPDMQQSPPSEGFLAPRAALPVPEQPSEALRPDRLVIPAIAVDTPVVEVFVVDGAWEVADYAAGYLHGTGLPGDPGNLALAGHAGLRGAVFRDLGRLAVGDDLFVDAGGWRYQYRVREARNVWPTDVDVLHPTKLPTITLITCTNWDTQRLVVMGDLIGARPLAGE